MVQDVEIFKRTRVKRAISEIQIRIAYAHASGTESKACFSIQRPFYTEDCPVISQALWLFKISLTWGPYVRFKW